MSRFGAQCWIHSTMKTKTLSVIPSYVCLFVIHVLGSAISQASNVTESGQRVLNAEAADPAKFPFLLRLHKDYVICGATIISNYFILTAAHCIFDLECSTIEIYPSTWVEGIASSIQATQCIVQEEYTDPKFTHDIALMKTSTDLLADGILKAIPLPEPGTQYSPGTHAVVVGWGMIEDGTYPNHLLRGDVLIEDWATCNDEFYHTSDQCQSNTPCSVPHIPKRSICTRGQDSSPPGTCYGDSGGPVIINGVIAGIVSGVILKDKTCKIGAPSLHTNVVDYLPWIYSIIEPDKDTSQFPVAEES